MSFLQRLGLLMFLVGAFARIEYFVKELDDITNLIILYVVLFVGQAIFIFSNSNQEKKNKE